MAWVSGMINQPLFDNTTHLSRTHRPSITKRQKLEAGKAEAIQALEKISRSGALSMADRPILDKLKREIQELRAV